jgi:inhibitor of cysteine peptidase
MRKTALLLILALAVLAAGCYRIDWAALLEGPGEGPTTTTTRPGGPGYVRGPVYIDSVELLLLESYPVQVQVRLQGTLPTPCHRLAWDLRAPDTRGRITLDVYSAADPGIACIQALEPFEQVIDVGSFIRGSYILVVNGVQYPFTI